MTQHNGIRMLITGLVFATAVGCAPVASPPIARVDSLVLPGTGDSQDVLRELARSYAAHDANQPVVVPDSIGSDGGIRVVDTGESPIGRVARRPTAEERATYGEFQYIEFARVPVAFVVNPRAGVHNLSEQQICDMFSGRLTNWKDVGGHDLPIDVQARPEDGSNARTIRQNMVCFTKLEVTP